MKLFKCKKTLFQKLVNLLYPNGYIDAAIGKKASCESIEKNTEKHENVPLYHHLRPSIRWCDEKKDYVVNYRIPRNIELK